MANTRYEAVKPLEPGRPVRVIERDGHGMLIGVWHGYWNYKRGTVSLYPNPKGKFVFWPDGVIPGKRIVSDRVVSVRKVEKPAPRPMAKAASKDKGEDGDAMQERIKFN